MPAHQSREMQMCTALYSHSHEAEDMMIDITLWTDQYMKALKDTFGDRIWFAGIQGSYGRGEATEDSDIDMVVILDDLMPRDIDAYDAMLDTLDHREQACGFLSGMAEIMRWEPSDLFQFCHDTKPILGSLDAVLKRVDAEAVARAIRTGACNVYHGCVHNRLYEKNEALLHGLCKSASFVVRARVWQQTGHYVGPLVELEDRVDEMDRPIVAACMVLKNGETPPFAALSETLFRWAGEIIRAGEAK